MRYEKKKILRLVNSLSFFYLFFDFFFHFLLLVNDAKVENMRKKCPQGKKKIVEKGDASLCRSFSKAYTSQEKPYFPVWPDRLHWVRR